MSSKDLLNQPLKDDSMEEEIKAQGIMDDNFDQLSGAEAISAFLSGGKKTESTEKGGGFTPQGGDAGELEGLESDLKKAQAALKMTTLTPEERYKKVLESADISLSEAREIIDCVVVQLKPWRESFKLAKSLTVTFQTRMPDDIQRLRRVIEEMAPKFQATREFESAKYNIAASLVRYGDHKFEHGTEEDIRNIIKWLGRIPVPAFDRLQQKLYEFDRKVMLVFSPGYLENF